MTVTVPAQGTVEGVFDMVRHTSKSEPPLRNLHRRRRAPVQINTIAEVTFYGRDQAGNEVTVSGHDHRQFRRFRRPAGRRRACGART